MTTEKHTIEVDIKILDQNVATAIRVLRTYESALAGLKTQVSTIKKDFDTNKKSSDEAAVAFRELANNTKLIAMEAGGASAALRNITAANVEVAESTKKITREQQLAQQQMQAQARETRRVFQNVSFQAQDIIVSWQNGQKLTTILTQQGPQIAGAFGAIGAAVGVGIAAFGVLAGVIETIIPKAKTFEESMKEIDAALNFANITSHRRDIQGIAEDWKNADKNSRQYIENRIGAKLADNADAARELGTQVTALLEPMRQVEREYEKITGRKGVLTPGQVAQKAFDFKGSIKQLEEMGTAINDYRHNGASLESVFQTFTKLRGEGFEGPKDFILTFTALADKSQQLDQAFRALAAARNATATGGNLGTQDKGPKDPTGPSPKVRNEYHDLYLEIMGLTNSMSEYDKLMYKVKNKMVEYSGRTLEAAQAVARLKDHQKEQADALKTAGENATFYIAYMEAMGNSMSDMEKVQARAAIGALDLASAEGRRAAALAQATDAQKAANAASKFYLEYYEKVSGKMTEVEKVQLRINAGVIKAGSNEAEWAMALARTTDETNRLKDAEKALSDQRQAEEARFKDVLSVIGPGVESYTKKMEIISQLWASGYFKNAAEVFAAQKKALEDLDPTLKSMEQRLAQIQDRFTSGLADAFLSADNSFRKFASNFLRTIAKMIIETQILSAMKMFNDSPTGGGWGSAIKGALSWLFSAKGNAFGGATGLPHGVYDKPTFFPIHNSNQPLQKFAKGGVLAEAGYPEAILPLRRGSDGRLGVESQAPVVNIYNNAPVQVRTEQEQDGSLAVYIEQVKSAIARDIRSGVGSVTSAMQGTYGLNRAAGAR